MTVLYYKDAMLHVESISLKEIAEKYSTPLYIYSRAAIEDNFEYYKKSFATLPTRISYAVKANGNLTILRLLDQLGAAFDIVSVGELERVLLAGSDSKKITFSGVGKTSEEIERAIEVGIGCFNVESIDELMRLNFLAEKNKARVNIALRVNPNIDPHTHMHISTGLRENKFGIDANEIIPLCHGLAKMPALNLIGLASHIGSQMTTLEPIVLSIDHLLSLYQALKEDNIPLQHLNIGGGLGIQYHMESPPSIEKYATVVKEKLHALPIEVIVEPGRSLIGDAGILLTRIQYIKHNPYKSFAIVDAGMTELLRPALYNAWQNILPVKQSDDPPRVYDIAGPICESTDILGKQRNLAIQAGDLLAIDTVGAYGFCMSANYNARYRPAEIMVFGEKSQLIRKRETITDLVALEQGIEIVSVQ